MSDFAAKIAGLSPQKLALLCTELKSALDAETRRSAEPVAIIGIGCRMPGGANHPAAFWKLLRDGRDATREVPPGRWNLDQWYDPDPDTAGRMYTSRGGFIDRVDGFDPAFFRLSPREAAALDPQQRLLLEVSWEAFEDAGVVPAQLLRSRTGVFVGIGLDDYAKRQVRADAPIDVYSGTGNAFCFASGRLSYFYGLQGPSISLDTACSSSLVTVHLACQSLRNRDCDQAIAGGVNLMLSPEPGVFLSRAKALSPDGRCKTFDAGADGYSRSEGCGMLVLRRLTDAQASGDRILAVIRGSAVNHDGPSSGLTVPNGQAQQDVIRQAMRNAGVAPPDISYLEAHGTGTALGDPIEIRALAEVFAGRPDPLWIGSVKTNVGHLETGAGATSLIKVILALQNQELPPHLHFRRPNPHLSLDAVPARVPVAPVPWPRGVRPRIAGVSSFGLSGTNSHVVLEEAPAPLAASLVARRAWRLQLSAASPEALERTALVWVEWLGSDEARHIPLRDICYTATSRRTRHKHEIAVCGDSHESLARHIELFLEGRNPAVPETVAAPREGSVVSLPPYPFDRRRCWYEEAASIFDFTFSRTAPAWTADHCIYGAAVFPATAYLALADRAARDVYGWGAHAIRDFAIRQPLLIPEQGEVSLRLVVKPGGEFEFSSGGAIHVVGRIELGASASVPSVPPPAGGKSLDAREYYSRLQSSGFDYGPAFRGIEELRDASGALWTRVELPSSVAVERDRYALHPALLDACMQSLGQAFEHLADEHSAWLPVGLDEFRIHRPGVRRVWCRIEPGSTPENASLRVFTDAGLPVAAFIGLHLRRTPRETLLRVDALPPLPHDWFYQLAWRPCPREMPAPSKVEGRWLIAGSGNGLAAELARRLRDRGATVDLRSPDDPVADLAGLTGAVHLAALDSDDLSFTCGSALLLAQRLARAPAPLWIVTAGAHEANPMQAPLWGFGRTLSLEHPELWGGLIDLDPGSDIPTRAAALEAELTAPDAERQLAFPGGIRCGARLERAAFPSTAPVAIHPHATYLITGGTGELGGRVARWLESRGARHIVRAGRAIADLSREEDVVALLRRIAADMPPLRGIVHCAGVLDDGVIAQQTWDRYETVLGPKLGGALFLDRHTRHLPLDFFVLFSAFSTMLGSPGQSSYVAANHCLDSLARNRRANGLPALSIGWGPFSEAGMSARLGERHAQQRRAAGIGDVPPGIGIRLLERLLGTEAAHLGVLPVDWPKFLAAFDTGSQPLLSGFRDARDASRSEARPERLDRDAILEYLRSEIARELQYPAGQLPQASQSLPELGLDSLLALELRNRLSRDLGVDIAIRLFFESVTIADLAGALANQVCPPSRPVASPAGDDALAGLHELSESELDALLRGLEQGDRA